MKKIFTILTIAISSQQIFACDFCAVYSAVETSAGKGFYAGVAQQWTHFGTLQMDGHEVANETGQHLDSSISQLLVGYNFCKRFGVQFNAPIIYRSFKRPEGFQMDEGTESGIGDVSLIGRFTAYRRVTEDKTVIANLLGGVKFPTGDSSRLKEEFNEIEIPEAPESGIHGHDLTLGSGSFDGIIGGNFYVRYHRAFFSAGLQYAIRTKGDFDYQFANDLTWSGGPGWLLVLREGLTLSLQANVSGETKGKDTFQEEKAEDTGITAVYIGPEFTVTWRENLNAEVGVDLPVSINNTALQAVPDYRVHAALMWRF